MKFKSKTNPELVVELISEAQLRIGETKRLCVIYSKDGQFYVRTRVEFFDKFKLDESPMTS